MFFEWARDQGYSMADLAKRLGYSERHLYRIKNGEYPVTRAFQARVVFEFGADTRGLFLPEVTQQECHVVA